jgi:phytoene desaturase
MSDYDVLVIGAGLGGVSSASLLAAKGLKVLVLEQSEKVGGCCSTFELEGFRFDVGASIVMVVPPLDLVFQRMGLRREDYVELIPCDPIYSMRTFDGQRFTIPTDIDAATEVVARIAPEDLDGWKRYTGLGLQMVDSLGDMMATPMNSLAELGRMVRKNPRMLRFLPFFARSHYGVTMQYFKNPVMQSSVAFQSYYAGAPPDLGLGILGFIALCEHLGIYYPRGGMIAIPEGIRRAGEERGLEVRFGCKVERIILEGDRVKGVMLEDGTEIYADTVISNVNAKVTYLKMIGPERLPRWVLKAISSYQVSMPCPMIYLGLDTAPPLDAHHTIYPGHVDDCNKLWHDYYLKGVRSDRAAWLISWPSESDPGMAPPGCHSLNFVYGGLAPYNLAGDNWDRIKHLFTEEALGVMEREVMPDLRDHIVVMDTSTPLDFERRLLSPQGAIYGLFLDFFSAVMFRPHPRSRAFRGLYLAGASTGLGGGVPTTLASGIVTSDYVLRDLG